MNKKTLVLVAVLSGQLLACTALQKPRNVEESNMTSENIDVIEVPVLEVSVELDTNRQSLQTEQLKEKSTQALTEQKYKSEVRGLCEELGNRLGSVSEEGCNSHHLTHSGFYSVDGRALVYKDYLSKVQDVPKVLVVGGIHGDEYSAFSLMFRWLEKLDKEEEHAQSWRLLPASNPDGLLSYRPAKRMNANGVDLNRNFLTEDWQEKAQRYWRKRTSSDPRRNPGKTAASEPETQWISQIVQEWEPDVIVAVHAPYGILDFDAPSSIRIRPPSKIGMLHLNLLGTYPGSLGRYGAQDRNIPVLTLELPHAGIMPTQQQQQGLWRDLVNWLTKKLPAKG